MNFAAIFSCTIFVFFLIGQEDKLLLRDIMREILRICDVLECQDTVGWMKCEQGRQTSTVEGQVCLIVM